MFQLVDYVVYVIPPSHVLESLKFDMLDSICNPIVTCSCYGERERDFGDNNTTYIYIYIYSRWEFLSKKKYIQDEKR